MTTLLEARTISTVPPTFEAVPTTRSSPVRQRADEIVTRSLSTAVGVTFAAVEAVPAPAALCATTVTEYSTPAVRPGTTPEVGLARSEERRVGKECRSRWS